MKDLRVILRRNKIKKSKKKYVIQDYSNGRMQIGKAFKKKTDALKTAKELWNADVINPDTNLDQLSKDLQIKLLQAEVLDLKKKH